MYSTEAFIKFIPKKLFRFNSQQFIEQEKRFQTNEKFKKRGA